MTPRVARITPTLVSGSYEAFQFGLYRESGPSENVQGAGGHLRLNLRSDRTAGGHMLIPEDVSTMGERMDVTPSRTFLIDEGRISFDLDSKTFLEETAWYYRSGNLRPLVTPSD